MLNQTILVGRLTRDPQLRKTQTQLSVINITVACESGFEDKKKTDFINCVVWNKQAEFIANNLHKGSLVAIQGKIQSRSRDDQNGKKQYVQEVLVGVIKALESKSSTQQQKPAYDQNSSAEYSDFDNDNVNDFPALDIDSDDLPF